MTIIRKKILVLLFGIILVGFLASCTKESDSDAEELVQAISQDPVSAVVMYAATMREEADYTKYSERKLKAGDVVDIIAAKNEDGGFESVKDPNPDRKTLWTQIRTEKDEEGWFYKVFLVPNAQIGLINEEDVNFYSDADYGASINLELPKNTFVAVSKDEIEGEKSFSKIFYVENDWVQVPVYVLTEYLMLDEQTVKDQLQAFNLYDSLKSKLSKGDSEMKAAKGVAAGLNKKFPDFKREEVDRVLQYEAYTVSVDQDESVVSESINVRSFPSIELGTKTEVLEEGQKVIITKETTFETSYEDLSSTWVYINYEIEGDIKRGWGYKVYLEGGAPSQQESQEDNLE